MQPEPFTEAQAERGPQPGTPTPWLVEEGHIQRDSNGIRYWQITDGQDAIACNQFCFAGYDPAVNAANAAAIVHRVNNWDALVAERDTLAAELAKRDAVIAGLVGALGDEEGLRQLRLLYRHVEDDSRQFTRWQMLVAIDHGMRIAADALAQRDAEIARLRGALKPFAFLEVGQDEDEPWTDTQSVWEAIYNDRVQDWIAFEEIDAARAALGATDEA